MTRRHITGPVAAYRDGDHVIEEEFPLVIADGGEIVVEARVALQVKSARSTT